MKKDFFRNRNKYNKSTYDIAKEANIEEDKVKEIMRGERELPTERVDDFVEILEKDNTTSKNIKLVEAHKWYESINPKEKRLEFNYTTQTELAKKLGVDTSTVCRLEKGEKVTEKLLLKYYDFFTDEINKKLPSKAKEKHKYHKKKMTATTKEYRKYNVDVEEIYEWYKNTDMQKLLENINYMDLVEKLGYARRSSSIITDVAHKRYDYHKTGKVIINKLYEYFNGKNDIIEEKKEIVENEEKNKEIEKLDTASYGEIQPKVALEITYEKYMTILKANSYLHDKVKELEEQINRYEKLIDLIK